MIVIRKTPLFRFIFSKWSLITATGIGLLIFVGCGQADPQPDDFMVGMGGKCTCIGTALHCDAQNNQAAVDIAYSEYCEVDIVQKAGTCGCQGTSLVCNNVGSCVFSVGGCFLGLGNQKIVTVCSQSGFNSTLPAIKAESVMPGGAGGVITFLNDDQCAGGAPPPPPPPGTPSGGGGGTGGGGGGGCACEGVDYICKNPNGSIKSASYNATECGGSGACNCREPNKTLACPDGTYADFNPSCTGGGGNLCGNHVCDPGEDSTNCQVDCGKP